ncbi:MAG: DUF4124 domain-containing protein, partial [Akkermansia sp.]
MKTPSIATLLLLSSIAQAQLNSYTDAAGTTHISGTNAQGQRVNITQYKDAAGTTHSSGSIGNDRVNTSSYRDAAGTTHSSGSIGR